MGASLFKFSEIIHGLPVLKVQESFLIQYFGNDNYMYDLHVSATSEVLLKKSILGGCIKEPLLCCISKSRNVMMKIAHCHLIFGSRSFMSR